LKSGNEVIFKGTFTIDHTKELKVIDLTITEGYDGNYKGKLAPGVYQLKDGELKWCMSDPLMMSVPKSQPWGPPQQIDPKYQYHHGYTFSKNKP
jgi:uncharacterized protein (TIGR03067 family)